MSQLALDSPKIAAKDILALLEQKHAGDVFVPECKDGPTQGVGGHRRMDAWAMKRSWSNPDSFGYEIKVSRSDFLGDNKWQDYLPLCTQFYFVCPSALIQPDELSEGCGLIWVSKTGTKLYTKRKAPRRDVELPEDLYRYILMARSAITRDRFEGSEPTRIDRAVSWERWLADENRCRDIGYRVSGHIAKVHLEIQSENRQLRSRIAQYEQIQERIRELGFDPETEVYGWKIDRALEKALGQVDPRLAPRLRNAADQLTELAEMLEPAPATGASS